MKKIKVAELDLEPGELERLRGDLSLSLGDSTAAMNNYQIAADKVSEKLKDSGVIFNLDTQKQLSYKF